MGSRSQSSEANEDDSPPSYDIPSPELSEASSQLQECIRSRILENVDAILSPYRDPQNPSQLTSDAQRHLSPSISAAMETELFSLVRSLLDQGIQVDFRGVSLAVAHALATGSTSVLEMLLDHGWEIQSVFLTVENPILSSMVRTESLTQWVLSHGADPNAVNRFGSSMARVSQFAPLSTIKLLADHGGRVHETDAVVKAAIGHAEGEPDRLQVVEYLAERGAPVNAFDMQFCDPRNCMSMVLIKGKLTALHHAAKAGKADLVTVLLRLGADRSSTSFEGKTALNLAVENGHTNIAGLLQS